MKKVISVMSLAVVSIFPCHSQETHSYTPIEQLTGTNPNTELQLRLEQEERMKKMSSDFQNPIEYKIPGILPSNDEGPTQNDILNNEDEIRKALNSDDPYIRRKAYDAILDKGRNQALEAGVGKPTSIPYDKPMNDPKIKQQDYDDILNKGGDQAIEAGVGKPTSIPYDKSMDEFINGVYGYNPNLSLEGNRKYYNDNGYTISYKVKDTTIYAITGISVFIILMIFFYVSKRQTYREKFVTENASNNVE